MEESKRTEVNNNGATLERNHNLTKVKMELEDTILQIKSTQCLLLFILCSYFDSLSR